MRPVETTSSYVRMQEGDLSDKHPCARHGFNSYRLPDDLNSSKVILRDRVVWNYLISETTCFQGRSLLSCAETPSVKQTPSRHVCRYGEGNSEGGFTPQRYEKFFNWQWILGNGQWKFDNRQLFFWQVVFKPLRCNHLHGRAELYIPEFAYRCVIYARYKHNDDNDKWQNDN